MFTSKKNYISDDILFFNTLNVSRHKRKLEYPLMNKVFVHYYNSRNKKTHLHFVYLPCSK